LSTLGGKLPCSIGWLIGEVLGKFPGGVATGAVQEAIKEKNLSLYKRNFPIMYLELFFEVELVA